MVTVSNTATVSLLEYLRRTHSCSVSAMDAFVAVSHFIMLR